MPRVNQQISRRLLYGNAWLQIGLFEARPTSDGCGEVERQDLNTIVLPLSGVFSKHDRPGHHVVGTPSHAVFFAPDAPYRIGFPGAIGDRGISLRFGAELAPAQLDRNGWRDALAPHGLLPANAILLRNLLWRQLRDRTADALDIEARALDLLRLSLQSVRPDDTRVRLSTRIRRLRAVERVKEAVAQAPAEAWDVARLAGIAHMSPFHLAHTFRQFVGTSLYDYVLRERLAQALDAVLERSADLTTIALDAGFASHSHFTARFRRFFGATPDQVRRTLAAGRAAEMRRIVTAPVSRRS
jgi:AraC-like DNA-binding protein